MAKQFCLRGHDTHTTGRRKTGHCNVCVREADLRRYRALDSEGKASRRLVQLKSSRKRAGIKDADSEVRSGNCPACGTFADPLHLDHDHATGEKRGWLCPACNTALGLLQDNPTTLQNLIEYLKGQ